MPVSATEKLWTLDEFHALPDDGNKYELVHGVLFVTPAPTPGHETVASRLTDVLTPFVLANRLGRVYHPRAVVRYRGSEVEPDLMVRPELGPDDDWERAPQPILVVEILSPSTRRRDAGVKRELYAEAGIPDYWVVNATNRSITVVHPGEPDRTVHHTLRWEPRGAAALFELAVPDIFP